MITEKSIMRQLTKKKRSSKHLCQNWKKKISSLAQHTALFKRYSYFMLIDGYKILSQFTLGGSRGAAQGALKDTFEKIKEISNSMWGVTNCFPFHKIPELHEFYIYQDKLIKLFFKIFNFPKIVLLLDSNK